MIRECEGFRVVYVDRGDIGLVVSLVVYLFLFICDLEKWEVIEVQEGMCFVFVFFRVVVLIVLSVLLSFFVMSRLVLQFCLFDWEGYNIGCWLILELSLIYLLGIDSFRVVYDVGWFFLLKL